MKSRRSWMVAVLALAGLIALMVIPVLSQEEGPPGPPPEEMAGPPGPPPGEMQPPQPVMPPGDEGMAGEMMAALPDGLGPVAREDPELARLALDIMLLRTINQMVLPPLEKIHGSARAATPSLRLIQQILPPLERIQAARNELVGKVRQQLMEQRERLLRGKATQEELGAGRGRILDDLRQFQQTTQAANEQIRQVLGPKAARLEQLLGAGPGRLRMGPGMARSGGQPGMQPGPQPGMQPGQPGMRQGMERGQWRPGMRQAGPAGRPTPFIRGKVLDRLIELLKERLKATS